MAVINGTSSGVAEMSKTFCGEPDFTQTTEFCASLHATLKNNLTTTGLTTKGDSAQCKDVLKCQDGCINMKDMVDEMRKSNLTQCYKDCIIMEKFMKGRDNMLDTVENSMRRCFSKNIMTCKQNQTCYSYKVEAKAKVWKGIGSLMSLNVGLLICCS